MISRKSKEIEVNKAHSQPQREHDCNVTLSVRKVDPSISSAPTTAESHPEL